MNALTRINKFFIGLEESGLVKRTPGILTNYKEQYPHFQELESNYEEIRRECEHLLSYDNKLHDVEGMAGQQTIGGIHQARWKSFMFKAGSFIDENCNLCPETARMLKKIPGIKQAFFSIVYPNQYIKPHRGYYYGFLRYHLGVIIPENNQNNRCWLRIHDDPQDNKNYDKTTIGKGRKYYWKNGEGIIFNDNYLHDASNESDEIRVVLWIDVVRKFPFWINWLNLLALSIAYSMKKVKKIEDQAVVKDIPGT